MNNRSFDIISCGVIVCAVTILYWHSFAFGLTYLDDNVWLKDYRWYLQNTDSLTAVFLKPDVLFSGLFYRPMIYLSFILDTRLGWDGLISYRATNLLLHGLNCCLVYGILRLLGYHRKLVLGLSLFFSVHPLLTQAVVWIPGRTESLLGFFVFAGLASFLIWIKRRGWPWLVLYMLMLAAALLTKETAVVLPVMCCLYMYLGEPSDRRGGDALTIGGLGGGLLLVYFFLRQQAVGPFADIPSDMALGTILKNFPAVIGYLGKIFIPVNLSVLPVLQDIRLIYGWIVLLVLTLLLFSPTVADRRRLLFGMLWFVGFLIPSFVLSFLKHEYRIYIPLLGMLIFILETGTLQYLLRKKPKLCVVGGLIILTVFSLTNWQHARHSRERIVFWESAVRTSPSAPLAHRNLGAMYFMDKRFDEAEEAFHESLRLSPVEPMVNNNLAVIYEKRGDYIRAEQAYLQEIKINPLYDNVYYNLGLLYASQDKFDLAVAHWKKAAELNPRNLMAYKYLVFYYVKSNQPQKAQIYIRELQQRGVAIPNPIDALIR